MPSTRPGIYSAWGQWIFIIIIIIIIITIKIYDPGATCPSAWTEYEWAICYTNVAANKSPEIVLSFDLKLELLLDNINYNYISPSISKGTEPFIESFDSQSSRDGSHMELSSLLLIAANIYGALSLCQVIQVFTCGIM